MGEITGIEWTDSTFNAWIGCERVSPECDNCYADRGSKRLAAQHGLNLWGGDRYFTVDGYWKQPATWDRAAKAAGVRHRVFCNSFGDVFERRGDLVDRRTRLLHLIEATPSLDWLLLSKRPENMIELASPVWRHEWPPNVWAGTTVGVQASLKRAASLLTVPAAVRFVSCEPLLEPIDLSSVLGGLAWVIVGGESGPKARPFHTQWARSLRDACAANGVAFFFKQLGEYAVDDHGPHAGLQPRVAHKDRDRTGKALESIPADLRIREFPPAVDVPAYPGVGSGPEQKKVPARAPTPPAWPNAHAGAPMNEIVGETEDPGNGCVARCWTRADCAECGYEMAPRGRSQAPGGPHYCQCDASNVARTNPRHLWDIHDSTRGITDPRGWAAHVGCCLDCAGAA
jgi:protein gp37